MRIQNTKESMVWLWRLLVRTRKVLFVSHRMFCPLNVLKVWRDEGVIDVGNVKGGVEELCFEVCRLAELEGYELLRRISLYPRKHRELLRAVVAVSCGIGMRKVDLRALDSAFSEVFPYATAINVSKKHLSWYKARNGRMP